MFVHGLLTIKQAILLDKWMSKMPAVAKIALEDQPQLLETLSVLVRSEKMIPHRYGFRPVPDFFGLAAAESFPYKDLKLLYEDLKMQYVDLKTRYVDLKMRYEDLKMRYEDLKTRYEDLFLV
jgi:hypothetical protein